MTATARTMVQKMGKVTVVDFNDAAITDVQQIQQITEELDNIIDLQDQKYLLLDFQPSNSSPARRWA